MQAYAKMGSPDGSQARQNDSHAWRMGKVIHETVMNTVHQKWTVNNGSHSRELGTRHGAHVQKWTP